MAYIDIEGDRLGVGSSCFVRAEGDSLNLKPFIARIQKIEPDPQHGGHLLTVRWYYRPEDPGIPGGRKAFHGKRELYYSDHSDVIHSATVLGRCCVHSLEQYRNLETIRPQDYFRRFNYSVKTRKFDPEDVAVYCRCQQPENPDRPMSQCDACQQWFHPECCYTTLERIESCSVWRCPGCEQQHAAAVRAPSPYQPLQALQPLGGDLAPMPLGGGEGSGFLSAGAGLADPLLEMLQAQIAQQQQQHPPPQQGFFLPGW